MRRLQKISLNIHYRNQEIAKKSPEGIVQVNHGSGSGTAPSEGFFTKGIGLLKNEWSAKKSLLTDPMDWFQILKIVKKYSVHISG